MSNKRSGEESILPWLGLSVCVLVNMAMCGEELLALNLTNVERASLMFAGIALGFAGSGRIGGMFVFAITTWPHKRCMVVGSWISFMLGSAVAAGIGHLLAR